MKRALTILLVLGCADTRYQPSTSPNPCGRFATAAHNRPQPSTLLPLIYLSPTEIRPRRIWAGPPFFPTTARLLPGAPSSFHFFHHTIVPPTSRPPICYADKTRRSSQIVRTSQRPLRILHIFSLLFCFCECAILIYYGISSL